MVADANGSSSTHGTPGPLDLDGLDLDGLAQCSLSELFEHYKRAQAPARVDVLRGDLRGRMLRVRGLRTARLRAFVAALARHRAFVWEGKSFGPVTASEGGGINRVRLGSVLGRQRLFPFATRMGPSEIDGEPAMILDYSHPDNPAYIRAIHDEVREVVPGLYLGPAMWKSAGSHTTVLWFALEAP